MRCPCGHSATAHFLSGCDAAGCSCLATAAPVWLRRVSNPMAKDRALAKRALAELARRRALRRPPPRIAPITVADVVSAIRSAIEEHGTPNTVALSELFRVGPHARVASVLLWGDQLAEIQAEVGHPLRPIRLKGRTHLEIR